MTSSPTEAFTSRTIVLLVADLDGYARAFRSKSDPEMVHFLDRYYGIAEDTIRESGGWIVKFIGDAVLAAFDEQDAARAVSVAVALREQVEQLGWEAGIPVGLGVNLHMGSAVVADLGKGPSRRRDVIGRTVNQTFLLGRGRGIRLSEPVYRKLPSGERTPWTKNKPPAVYILGGSGEPPSGPGKSSTENAARW
jgi:class 3 adenylate cyclase